MKSNLQYANSDLHHRTSLSWSAVLSGALVALGLGFLLQLFGLAIGLTAYHTNTSGTTFAVGGFLALLLGVIVSMGLAGFVAGCLGRFCCYHSSEAVIYGFLTWSLALLLSALLMLPLTKYASSYKEALLPKVLVSEGMSKNLEVKQKPQTSTNAPTTQPAQTQPSVAPQPEVKITPAMLTSSSWALFILFFLGAISTCAGAYCGMNCVKRHKPDGMEPFVKDPNRLHG